MDLLACYFDETEEKVKIRFTILIHNFSIIALQMSLKRISMNH